MLTQEVLAQNRRRREFVQQFVIHTRWSRLPDGEPVFLSDEHCIEHAGRLFNKIQESCK